MVPDKNALKSTILITASVEIYNSIYLRDYCDEGWRQQLNNLNICELIKEFYKILSHSSVRTIKYLRKKGVYRKSPEALKCVSKSIRRPRSLGRAFIDKLLKENKFNAGK